MFGWVDIESMRLTFQTLIKIQSQLSNNMILLTSRTSRTKQHKDFLYNSIWYGINKAYIFHIMSSRSDGSWTTWQRECWLKSICHKHIQVWGYIIMHVELSLTESRKLQIVKLKKKRDVITMCWSTNCVHQFPHPHSQIIQQCNAFNPTNTRAKNQFYLSII